MKNIDLLWPQHSNINKVLYFELTMNVHLVIFIKYLVCAPNLFADA